MPMFNAAEWLIDRHVRDGGGDRVAIRCQGVTTTYAELQTELWRTQNLLAELGVEQGERVAMVVPDDATFPAIFLGAQRSGIVPVPLSTMLRGRALGEIVADSGARTLAISNAFLPAIPELLATAPAVNNVIALGDDEAIRNAVGDHAAVHGWSSFNEIHEAPIANTTNESIALWLYSSGTTGTPKGVMHLHGSVKATVDTYAFNVLGITADDRFLSVAKLFFAYGLGNSLTFPFAVGATAILNPDPPTPRTMLTLIEDEQPTLFFSSPGFCAALLDAKPDQGAFDSVRATVTAGESLPANVHERFSALTGTPVLDGIGSTELLHIFISNTMERQTSGSSGEMVPGYIAELRDDNDNPIVDPDTPGYLHVHGPSTAVGYWQKAEATANAFRDGWVRTGDVYTRSADDTWTFLGRNTDMIKAGGIWVSPAEVENVLIEHDSVLEAAVVGGRDEQGLEQTVAFVLPASGWAPDADELIQHCRDRMASFKRPRRVIIVDELPKTATGKIKRFELRQSLDN
jgi:benzoate-CoA ligase family protein